MSERFIEDPQQSDFENPAFLDFFETWQQMSGPGRKPQHKNFSLLTFSDHVTNMNLMEYDRENDQYKGKYFGSALVDRIGFDPTDLAFEDVFNAGAMRKRIDWLTTNGKPYLSLNSDLTWGSNVHKTYDVVNCPLFDENDRVSAIVGLMGFAI